MRALIVWMTVFVLGIFMFYADIHVSVHYMYLPDSERPNDFLIAILALGFLVMSMTMVIMPIMLILRKLLLAIIRLFYRGSQQSSPPNQHDNPFAPPRER